ncbi:MAG: hypothetical protein FIB08_09780 [Candidatus Methanoperedens sp.]|nr:hypothetical protein [Candidatus Methanoperedens sp.]
MLKQKILSPALVLFFLSPMVGELLSGSSPPAEFFNPVVFLLLAALYGSGAIIARELTFRWGKGWATLLVLGAAYGIIEEGLMVKSFFDPGWIDLGILGSYGRWAGINWVWSLQLTIYHTVFSIAIPILLAGLMFPMRQSEPWVSTRTFRKLCILMVAVVIFGFLFITPYRPPLVHYLLTIIIVSGLIKLARRLPDTLFIPKNISVPSSRWFVVAGFLSTFSFFFISWSLPNTGLHPLLTILLVIGPVILVSLKVLKMSGNGAAWSKRHQLALASGALGFFILLAPLQELDKNRPDNTGGMTLVGIVAALFLIWMAGRVKEKEENI